MKHLLTLVFGILALCLTSTDAQGQNLYEYYLVKGSSKIIAKDYPGAYFYLTKAVERYPDSADGWYHRGGALYFMQELDKALSDFNHTLELDPSNSEVYKWRGMIHHQKQDFPHAETDYEQFLNDHPGDAFIRIKLAEVHIAQHQTKKAEKELAEILTKFPKNSNAHNAMGLLYEEEKNPQKALESFGTAIAIDGEQATYHMNNARVLSSMDRLPEACVSWKRAAELGMPDAISAYEAAQCDGPESPVKSE